MPLYAYECRECGVRFDRHQSFSDEPISECPECGGEVHRLIQPAGIIFKGSGFYVTDHRSGKSGAASGSRKGSAKPAGERDKTSEPAKNSSTED